MVEEEESGDAYAVQGGRILTTRMVQLGDGAMIQFVHRMPRGKNKKRTMKRMLESEQILTDPSSSEARADVAFEMVKMANLAGWGGERTREIRGHEEQEEEFLEQIRKNVKVELGVGAESMIEGLRTCVREQRLVERDRRKKEER